MSKVSSLLKNQSKIVLPSSETVREIFTAFVFLCYAPSERHVLAAWTERLGRGKYLSSQIKIAIKIKMDRKRKCEYKIAHARYCL